MHIGQVTSNIRCLIDSGAQTNLITMSCVRRFSLNVKPEPAMILGIGGHQSTEGSIHASIYSRHGIDLQLQDEFLIVSHVFGQMPTSQLERSTEGLLEPCELADESYDIPASVDIVLGAGVCARIFNDKILKLKEGLIALHTKIGWIVFGEGAEEESLLCHMSEVTNDEQLDASLRRLWEVDQVESPANEMTPEEVWCEENFENTCYRDHDGRYVTSISIKPENLSLGESYDRAMQRFKSLEKRFQRDPVLAQQYINFMREYESLGHMRMADRLVDHAKPHYYIPHHPVLKKFRVVFDASAKTTNGHSLNDIQFPGPKLQHDLYDTVLRFRIGRIALSADVQKMFRQVRIIEDQWDLQRILWREDPLDELKEYWLTVITYGLTSAGYNAVKALIKCASDSANKYPLAEKIVKDCFYMDDMLVSVNTTEEAKKTYQQVKLSLESGGFVLSKWASNCPEIIQLETDQLPNPTVGGHEISVLGLTWDSISDKLKFKVKLRERTDRITKRSIASDGAMIFDPNGYITPVTIRAKLFLQNLWRIGVQWDEELPCEITEKWISYYDSLSEIGDFELPRWIGTTTSANVQLHVFCDASIKAYGAAIYVRCEYKDKKTEVTLLTSKSKVADLQTITLPRMELCAAKLAAEMVYRVAKSFEIVQTNYDAFYWTDSEIVLHWLRKFPSELKVFVGNRVSTIQAYSKIKNWRHIDSKRNPADLISRGCSVSELKGLQLWWHGPNFLKEPMEKWPSKWKNGDPRTEHIKMIESERRRTLDSTVFLVTKGDNKIDPICLLEKFSSLTKIIRITAYVSRFIAKCKEKLRKQHVTVNDTHMTTRETLKRKCKENPRITKRVRFDNNQKLDHNKFSDQISKMIDQSEPISVTEYKCALAYWIKYTQKIHFPDELHSILRNIPVSKSSRIHKFVPFISYDEGIIRMRGRTDRASTTYDQKHPIILPGNSTLARRLIAEAHYRTSHGGSQLCMQYIRDKYWITGLRSVMRRYVRECVICASRRRIMSKQLMADLPESRVTANRPFTHCGVDYAGPLKLKPYKNYRGVKIQLTAYVAVFVCFSSKAVHLELVGDLTTQAFLAALDRMILRRNHIEHLYSDQGRNFIGAANELARVYQLWQSKDIIDELTVKGITWHFNTPLAPHHGGLWEAAVKSFKYHLYRVAGETLFTFEELSTILVRIEACLNSRPLVALSDDPMDLTTITPGHLLTGHQIVKPLGPNLLEMTKTDNIAWNKIREIEDDLWKRWSSDYLMELQRRTKWTTPEVNIKENTLVLLKDDEMPPGHWKRGRVIRVFPGKDGLVRSVLVKTATSEYMRPITKLCVLPVDANFMECTTRNNHANDNMTK